MELIREYATYIANQVDAARLAITSSAVAEYYSSAIPHVAPYAPAAIFLGICACVILLSKHSKLQLKWVANRQRGKIMKKQQQKADSEAHLQQHQRGLDANVNWIEDEVDEGTMTREDANHWYAKLYKVFPEMARAYEPPPNLMQRLNIFKNGRGQTQLEHKPVRTGSK